MQVRRHIYFDERALFYAASTYSRQIDTKALNQSDWYRSLRPTYAIQVLNYDSNRLRGIKDSVLEDTQTERTRSHPMADNQYLKHYVMTDKYSSQTINHLQMIQIELPRVPKKLFPPEKDFTEKDWWLSLFKHAKEYTRETLDSLEGQGIKAPDSILKAFGRLEMSRWEPEVVKEYATDVLDLEQYGSMLAVERAEGAQSANTETAKRMIETGDFTDDIIAKLTELSLEEVKGLRENSSE
ncbi:MAG: hypothetical protein HON43_00990 [Alphaproteobacteria bacterium]|jgi:predicted transposase/invertase (TIGR01784 family)|nr:hypothetical protein [Alphaproteobacteria bacterium]MBT5390212.1 hypothetical protein [Alphaproteobacteria bacterium]MBT5540747.1 hypothetical protein [Alphaproteobacteria bacterium]